MARRKKIPAAQRWLESAAMATAGGRVQEVAGLLEDLGLSTSLSDSELEAALRGGPAASESSRAYRHGGIEKRCFTVSGYLKFGGLKGKQNKGLKI